MLFRSDAGFAVKMLDVRFHRVVGYAELNADTQAAAPARQQT